MFRNLVLKIFAITSSKRIIATGGTIVEIYTELRNAFMHQVTLFSLKFDQGSKLE
jgi:hypothetical protein